MENKYKETISKIQVSEELKNNIIEKMEQEQRKRNGEIVIKIKKIISSIISIIGILACSGVVYAAVTGRIQIGERGIVFSDKYVEYEQKVENQYIEKDDTRVELVSNMCDDGFLVLQFEVELSDAIAEKENGGLAYLSFNDKLINEEEYKYLNLNGANYNLVIDGKEYWLKGATDSQIIENIRNKNYTVYQLYFLPSDVVESKETFTITLDDVIIAIAPDEGEFLEIDGSFEIEVSKEKAIQNTTTITNDEASVVYERLTHKIEKVSQTPMQTIIKVSSLLTDATLRNSTYLLAEDYIGTIEYKIYDQNDNELFVYTCINKYEYYDENEIIKTLSINEIGEVEEPNGYDKTRMEEYIVTERNEELKTLRIEVYEINEYYGRTRNIGTHIIDLENEKISCENKNKIIAMNENATVNYDNGNNILAKDIEYFDIEIEEENDITYYNMNYEFEYNTAIDDFSYVLYDDIDEQNATIIQYYISTWGDDSKAFYIILFKDKSLFDIYCEERSKEYAAPDIIEIDENDEYKIAVVIDIENIEIEDIRYITDTIKLK